MEMVDLPKVLKSFGLRKVEMEPSADDYTRRAWFHDLFSMSLAETYKKEYDPMLIQTWSFVRNADNGNGIISLREDKRDLVMEPENEYTQSDLIKIPVGDFEEASKLMPKRGGSIATRIL